MRISPGDMVMMVILFQSYEKIHELDDDLT